MEGPLSQNARNEGLLGAVRIAFALHNALTQRSVPLASAKLKLKHENDTVQTADARGEGRLGIALAVGRAIAHFVHSVPVARLHVTVVA